MTKTIQCLSQHPLHQQFHETMLSVSASELIGVLARHAGPIHRRMQTEIARYGNLILALSDVVTPEIQEAIGSPNAMNKPTIKSIFDSSVSFPKNQRSSLTTAVAAYLQYAHVAAAESIALSTGEVYTEIRKGLNFLHESLDRVVQTMSDNGLLQVETFTSIGGDVTNMQLGITVNRDALIKNCVAAGITTEWAEGQRNTNPYRAMAKFLEAIHF